MKFPFVRRAPVRPPLFRWIAFCTLAGVPAVRAADEAGVRPPDAPPARPAGEAGSLGVFGAAVRENVVRQREFSVADTLPTGISGAGSPGIGAELGGPPEVPAGGPRSPAFGWEALLGLAGPRPAATAPAPLEAPLPVLQPPPLPSGPRWRRDDAAAQANSETIMGRSRNRALETGLWALPAGNAAFRPGAAGPGPLPAGVRPFSSPAGIVGLPRSLPSPVPNATDYTATSNGGGQWQNPAIWNITPAGGQGFPNNTGDDTYAVTVNGNPSYDLAADVAISSLLATSGMTFQNASSRNFAVEGDFVSASGAIVTMSAVTLILNGDSLFNSQFDIRNGGRLLNNGRLAIGPTSAGLHLLDAALPANAGFSFVNTGTIVSDRPGTTTFQNHTMLNLGIMDVRQGTLEATSFTQTNAAVIRVKAGAGLRANDLRFNGGTVVASGSTLNGSQFSFRNATLIIGENQDDISNLTLSGNAAGDAGQGATFRFSLAGAGAGQYDTLSIQNGMNFNGLTLDIETLDGFEPAETDVFRIITGNNLSNGNFANVTGDVLDVPDLGTFNVTRNNSFVELSGFVPIPEPSLPALLAAGAAVLGLRRRGRA